MKTYKIKTATKTYFVDACSKKEAVDKISDKLIQSASEEALQKNITTEIKAGKDPKQAAAIAYSVQRENDECIKDDWKPDYAVWVKKSGKWLQWGGRNNPNINKNDYLKLGYEDVKVVPNDGRVVKDTDANQEQLTQKITDITGPKNVDKPKFQARGKWVWDNVKYDWYDTGRNMYYEEIRTASGAHINDSYYIISGYGSESDKKLKQDMSKASSYGLKTYVEKVDGSYQLTVEGSHDKVKKIVENYFAGDITSIKDNLNTDMCTKDAGVHQEQLAQMEYAKLKEQRQDIENEIDRNDNNPKYNLAQAQAKLDNIDNKIEKLKKDFEYAIEDSCSFRDDRFYNTIILDDVSVSKASDLKNILDDFIKRGKPYESFYVDINGEYVDGRLNIFINGGNFLINYEVGGRVIKQYVIKGVGGSVIDGNPITLSSINDMIRDLYSINNQKKAIEAAIKAGIKPIYLYSEIEFFEGNPRYVGKKFTSKDALIDFMTFLDARFQEDSTRRGYYDKCYFDHYLKFGKHKYKFHYGRVDIGDGESSVISQATLMLNNLSNAFIEGLSTMSRFSGITLIDSKLDKDFQTQAQGEKYLESKGFKIADKSFKVKYKDRTFIVKAKDHKGAANKVAKKLKENNK